MQPVQSLFPPAHHLQRPACLLATQPWLGTLLCPCLSTAVQGCIKALFQQHLEGNPVGMQRVRQQIGKCTWDLHTSATLPQVDCLPAAC